MSRDLASEIMKEADAKNRMRMVLKAQEAKKIREYAERRKHTPNGREELKRAVCPGCGSVMRVLSVPETNQSHYVCPGCSFVQTRNVCVDEGRALGEKQKVGIGGKYKGKTVVRMRPDGKIDSVRNV